jgi:phage FluMu protein Com
MNPLSYNGGIPGRPGATESMDTVQIQCGSCNKLMAISTAHLGGQVRCPHCQAIVQAPAPTPALANEPTELLPPPQIEVREADSIFAPPEEGEDLFGDGSERPVVEMPLDVAPAQEPPPALNHLVTIAEPPIAHDITEADLAPMPAQVPHHETHDADLAALKPPRRTADRGYLSLMLLILLVPYSILMTLFVVYLWYQLANQENGLQQLPDPAPKKDGARQVKLRVKHDQALAASQQVKLGGTIIIGAIQVTPEKVTRDEFGDLQLVLNVKNVSDNQAFSPMHPDFLRTVKGSKTNAMPYTFLDSPGTSDRIYGGHLAFERPGENDRTIEGELLPGQQEKLVVTAPEKKELVNRIVQSKEPMTWRVQLRRGLARISGQQASATAVIGVQFNASEIR